MPLLMKKSTLAAKIESAIGTAEAVLTADTDYNVFNLEFQQDIEFTQRQGQYAFGQMPGVLHGRKGTCTFSTEVTPGSTTTPPQWASAFLPACGLVASAGVYTPRTESPGSNVKTITIAAYQDGIKKILAGCMGNAVFRFEAGKVAMIDWTFMGKWVAPADVTLLAHTAASDVPLRFASSGFAVGSYSYKVNQFTLDLGNEVFMREDSADASGYVSAIITGRSPRGTFDPESDLIATKNNYGIFLARTEQALAVSIGDGTNNIAFAAPKLQYTNIKAGSRNGIMVENIDYQLNKSTEAGDDELSITFS